MKRTGLLMLVLCLCLIPGCQSPTETEAGSDMAFSDLEGARRLDVTFPQTRVFRSLEEWEAFWAAYCGTTDGNGETIPAPPVDFNSHMLVGVFYETVSHGCTNLVRDGIERITRYSNRLEAQVGPVPDLGDCASPAYPMNVVLMERVDLPVHFTGHVPG